MEVKKLLGLCMIARDEADFIKPCIESVKDITDEIVVIDTGSADQTPAIAEELGAKVYNYKWDNSFSRARNFAMSKCEAKWLLLLDADESLFDEDKEKLLDLLRAEVRRCAVTCTTTSGTAQPSTSTTPCAL